jgi:Calx-beta domain
VPARRLVIGLLLALAGMPVASATAAPKKVAFKFSATTYSVAENAGPFNLTIMRTGNTSAAASVQYSDAGTGTATGGGTDYSFTGGTVNFAAGETQKTVPVTIVDNTTANAPNKTIVFKLANATPAGAQIRTTTATLTILDDEGPGTLDFSSSAYTVSEGTGLATITVNRVGATNLKLSVDYATQTAATSPATAGADYTAISPAKTLTFNAGEVSKTFQVAIADDSNAESPEDVGLVLSNPKNLSGGAAPQLGPNGPATLTINDDDVSTFSFSEPAYSVHEDGGQATITVNRTGATNLPASIGYATSDGTATVAGGDYLPASGTLSFAAGETSKTFTVDVTNDGVAEVNETVNLKLTSDATTVDTSLLSIVDNDNPKASVQLSSPVYEVSEADGVATITVTLSHAVDADVSVDYATADGSALAGSDYTSAQGTLTFVGNVHDGGTGETSKTIEIPILQDTDVEDPETFSVTLSNAQPGASSALGGPATGTVTIDDDDPPGLIDFKSLRYDVGETDGQATVTVERVGGVGGAVSVDYQTVDGSATAGSDYTAASGTLHWAAGDSADKTFTIPVTWDGQAEGAETIGLVLSNPGGGTDLGPNNAAAVRIADDGASGPIALTSYAYRVGEADGVVTITAHRWGGSLGGPVTVDYATNDGTATAGSDYTATHGTLTFGPGEASKSFTVHVASDGVYEVGETFQVILANAGAGASLGSPAWATVTIADDNAAPSGTGGGTGTGTSPGGGPVPILADTTPPTLKLTARKLQRALKAKRLVLSVRCSERSKLAVAVRVKIGKKRVVLRRAKLTAAAGKTKAIKLKLSKQQLAKLRKAMKHGKVKVVLAVTATDLAANKATGSRTVTVKR